MTTTPNMGMILPDDHDGTEAELWGTILNTALTLNDSHDHSPGKGVLVPTTGMKIAADKSWSFGGTSFAITDLKAIDFAAVASTAVTSFAGALFVSDGTGGLTANELYWRTTSGSNVQLTSGTSLNVASFVGGIGGDYSAIGALVDYDDATDTYRFRQQLSAGVRQFAKMQCADIKLTEHDAAGDASVPGFGVTLRSPDALAGNYNFTWPLALPAVENTVSISSAGQMVFGHGDRVKSFSALTAAGQGGASWTIGSAGGAAFATSTAASSLFVPVELLVGDRAKSISFKVFGDGAADLTTTVRSVAADMTGSSIGSAVTTNQPASWSTVTIDITDTTITDLTAIQIEFSVSAANIRIGTINVTYDRPL